jgi:hypothetical protein
MSRIVDRWGRTKFAAVSSLVWALPMAAWAGSVDLQPGAGPWVAFGIGLLLLGGWLVLLSRLGRYPVTPRPRRLDLRAMSSAERRWNLGLFVFATLLIGWLNGAATVDWSILTSSIAAGHAGAIGLAVGLAMLLLVFAGGAVVTWRGSREAFRRRAG